MSLYAKTTKSSNVFNSNDIISQGDSNNSGIILNLDTSNFVQRSNPVFDDHLVIRNDKGIKFGSVIQNQAFQDTDKINLDTSKTKLTNINFANEKTEITSGLDLSSATLELLDEQIAQSKITGLLTRLEGIDTNLSNINNNDTDILNIQTDITNNIKPDIITNSTDLLTHITNYDNYKITNENDKIIINTNILENADKNDEQDLRLTTTENNVSTHITNYENNKITTDTSILNIETDITDNIKPDIITNSTDILTHITNYDNYKISNDGRILNIENDVMTNIKPDILTNETNLNNHIINYNTYTTDNTTLNTTQNNRLDTIDSLNTTQNNRLDTFDSLNTSHLSRLGNLETQQATNMTNITNNSSNILLKQNIINSTNRLNASYIGNGDVNNSKLSALNDIRTDVSIQSQLDVMKTELDLFDGSNVVANSSAIESLNIDVSNNTSNISTIQTDISAMQTDITANENSINTINTNLGVLTSADNIHDTQITNLQNQDTILQNNINLKNDIISLTNKLNTSLIFDINLNESLDTILTTIDNNIDLLNSDKQNKITTLNKLNSSLLNRNDNLIYCDATSSIQTQINNINDNITLLQGVDTTVIQDISDNFDTLNTSIINNTNAISTLQGLQDGDVISFQNINNSITNLTNTKQPLIDTNNKLNSSLLNRDDNLIYCDATSSIQTQINNLTSTKQDLLNNTTNKLLYDKIDFTGSNISNADYGSSINDKFNSLDTQITALNNTDTTQLTTNTSLQNQINSNSTDITNLQNTKQDVIDVNNLLSISNIDLTGSDLVNMDYSAGSITTKLNLLQSNIDNLDLSGIATNTADIATANTNIATNASNIALKLNQTDYKPKIDDISTGTFTSNILTYTFDENNIYMNQLTENNVFELNLTIDTPQNNKTYIQKILIDAEQYKGYANILKINNNTVEIKYKGGDTNINLAPIAGYSLIGQELQMTRINDAWFCMGDIKLFYNSASNKTYDITPPEITLLGDAVVNHEINTAFVVENYGYSAFDNIDGDITANVVVDDSALDISTLGSYNIYYNLADNVGNTDQKIRVVNVIDTTNPVVTLIGDAEIDINQDTTYTEQGATASDNSLETLTVVISGSVDTSTPGDYTINYTATDSTGNSHTIGRLIHVIPVASYTLQYSNPTTDIFTLSDHLNNMPFTENVSLSQGARELDFTLTGQASTYLNGYYYVQLADAMNSGDYLRQIFNYSASAWVRSTASDYETNDASGRYYTGSLSQVDYLTGLEYGGKFIEWKLPFFLELHKIDVYTAYAYKFALMGSSDGGLNYELIDDSVSETGPSTYMFVEEYPSNTKKFNAFKLILRETQWGLMIIRTFKIYGDIYTI